MHYIREMNDLPAADSTRDQLLDAAERLFVERGPDDVSARAIVREAGQKNQSALQYHFGGREGLITAIIERRMQQLEARREKFLSEALAESAEPDLRSLCAVMVRAPFTLCRDQRAFREFLGKLGQRLTTDNPDPAVASTIQALPSLQVLRDRVRAHLEHIPVPLLLLRASSTYFFVLLTISRRASMGGTFRGTEAELFFNNLVDQVAAMMAAPPSPDTESLLNHY